MKQRSVASRYLGVIIAILAITVMSVFFIERSYQMESNIPGALSEADKFEKVERIGTTLTIKTLDPVRADQALDILVCSMIYQTLFDYKPETGQIEPSSMVASTAWDNAQLQITLENEAMFHSGRRISAKDIKFSVERALKGSLEEALGFESLFEPLVGYDNFRTNKSEDIEGIVILSDNRVAFKWRASSSELLEALSCPEVSILEQTTLKGSSRYGEKWSQGKELSINGSGPVRLVSWNEDMLALQVASGGMEAGNERMEISFHPDADTIFYDIRLGLLNGAVLESLPTPEVLDVFNVAKTRIEEVAFKEIAFIRSPKFSNVSNAKNVELTGEPDDGRQTLTGESEIPGPEMIGLQLGIIPGSWPAEQPEDLLRLLTSSKIQANLLEYPAKNQMVDAYINGAIDAYLDVYPMAKSRVYDGHYRLPENNIAKIEANRDSFIISDDWLQKGPRLFLMKKNYYIYQANEEDSLFIIESLKKQ